MARSATASGSPPTSSPEITENNLQPFFVLHKGSSQKSEKKSSGTGKTRRRIDLSPSLPRNGENTQSEKTDVDDDNRCLNLRMEAFEAVWSKIESTIKNVLRDTNTNVFNEIHQWVRESFNTITSFGTPTFSEATRSFPIVTPAASKRLFTGMVLTKNMEFVDDLLTFKELGLHLKSQGCHVANLSSMDFSMKNGIGGCLRSLLRQFLMVTLDAADISILAMWYWEQGNCNNPVIIIIDDMERCCGSVLSDFILMLSQPLVEHVGIVNSLGTTGGICILEVSEWVLKVPVILIMGVATTLDAPRSLLPSIALHHLHPRKFILETPSEKMDAVVEAVLVKQYCGFTVSHKVAAFMRNYFVIQDGTMTAFIRALKIACAQHFSMEPLSFILKGLLLDNDSQVLQGEKHGLSLGMMIKNALLDLPSYARNQTIKQNDETLIHGLSELRTLQSHWSIVVLCLHEAGKYDNIRLLDLVCEALDPELYKSRISETRRSSGKDSRLSSGDITMCQQNPSIKQGSLICQAVRKLRDLPEVQLCKLLDSWEKHTRNVPQIHDKVKELLSVLILENSKSLKQSLDEISKKQTSRSHLKIQKDSKAANVKAASLMEWMVRNHMQPIECMPFHEIVCFKNVDKLQVALIGDPRRRIQVDLLDFHNIISCSCCSRSSNIIVPSMHDSSIAYTLAQEHSDLINVHDWYQSFKSVVFSSRNKVKHRSKHSPSPKKRKLTTEPAKPSESSIQARFCRAVTELQITGLLRMPSKRRPDYVQRIAFGL